MSDRQGPNRMDAGEGMEVAQDDTEASSTWSTIAGTADIDDLVNEGELEALMVEPTTGELGILADTDVPGEPG